MTRGLVIGKFMPVHHGHIALINFAATQCDELIVSMSYTTDDPIDPELRFSWIQEIFKDQPNIKLNRLPDDFDDESLPMRERTKIWADVIRKTYPPIHILFSSENYGEPFANHLGVVHKVFDAGRKQNPVSATLIRNHPFTYWSFIPDIVRPFFVKKICFYGPESTGKSYMAKKMAELYQTEFVPEVARELITSNDFTVDDIIRIGHAQTQRILDKTKKANKLLFCDSDLITTQIYSKVYLHEVPPVLFELEKQVHYGHYFLFDIDTPWIADGLRDLGHRREEMFLLFKNELEARKITYTLLRGSWAEKEMAIQERVNLFAI